MVIRQILKLLLVAIATLLSACAAGPQLPHQQVFPPSTLLPLNVAITKPLVPFSHEMGHEALETWNDSPGQRRLLMQCVWQDGLQNLVQRRIPGTKITHLGAGRDPLEAVGPGVKAELDTLQQVHFTLEGTSALDVARHRGWTHLVVPNDVQYFMEKDGEYLVLTAAAAIIDVLERRIVWQGIIDSRKISAQNLGSDDSAQPALTEYEAVTYRFVLDLAQILGRRLNPKPDSRHDLARPCQAPPPLLQE